MMVRGASVGGGWGVQLKGLFQRGSMDQRKECLYCDWEMGRAGEKNGRPAERAVCLLRPGRSSSTGPSESRTNQSRK